MTIGKKEALAVLSKLASSQVHKGTFVRQTGGLENIALQLRKIKDNFIELSQSSQVTSGMIILLFCHYVISTKGHVLTKFQCQ